MLYKKLYCDTAMNNIAIAIVNNIFIVRVNFIISEYFSYSSSSPSFLLLFSPFLKKIIIISAVDQMIIIDIVISIIISAL